MFEDIYVLNPEGPVLKTRLGPITGVAWLETALEDRVLGEFIEPYDRLDSMVFKPILELATVEGPVLEPVLEPMLDPSVRVAPPEVAG